MLLAAVPKATVDEDSPTPPLVAQIRFADDILGMQSIPNAQGKKALPKEKFRLGILAPDQGHDAAAGGRVHFVQWRGLAVWSHEVFLAGTFRAPSKAFGFLRPLFIWASCLDPLMGRRAKPSGAAKPGRRAISLFSGAGGMDLGVRDAGFEVLAQVERDHHCCESLRHENSRVGSTSQVVESDITLVDPRALRKQLNLESGQLDLLFGGPPCQSFSAMGKRGSIGDERGMLLFQMVRFAEEFAPKAIIVENVRGLVKAPDSKGREGGVLLLLLSEFSRLGYEVTSKVLNAAEYGVPQLRERLFIVATKGSFAFPAATHLAGGKSWFTDRPAMITVGQAIQGLGSPAPKDSPVPKTSHYDVTPARDRERISYVEPGSWLSASDAPADIRGRLQQKDSTKFRRLSEDKPSLTLRCGETFYHPTENRYLTPREYLRLHGYPDSFTLCGPIRGRTGAAKNMDQHRQVANSVPPPLAKAVATAVKDCLECPPSSNSSASRSLMVPA